MKKLVLIDGNSIMNRAFYGIMGNKILTSKDGKYTNAIYGFLAIMFKIVEDLNPEYMAVAFDLKGPTARHELYEGYKANRKGMPNELAEQMPIIKDILHAMNIDVIEKQGYEGDDILGTIAKYGEKQGLSVTILSGDRDTFQLASDNITIRIPRTKMGKTEVEDFDRSKVKEIYGIEPKQLIEVKALQGDTSDNIPGVPGIGEKTALSLIKKYESLDNLYKKIEHNEDDLKGKQKEAIIENKEQAYLSKTLGTINTEVPLEDNLENLRVKEWDKAKVLEIFKNLNFKKYIERYSLVEEEGVITAQNQERDLRNLFNLVDVKEEQIKDSKELVYYLELKEDKNEDKIIKKTIKAIAIYIDGSVQYLENPSTQFLKEIFENENIKKYGDNLTEDYIILKQEGIKSQNLELKGNVEQSVIGSAVVANITGNIENDLRLMSNDVKLSSNQNVKNNIYIETYNKDLNISDQYKNVTVVLKEVKKQSEFTFDKIMSMFITCLVFTLMYIVINKIAKKNVFLLMLNKVKENSSMVIVSGALLLLACLPIFFVLLILSMIGIWAVTVPILIIYIVFLVIIYILNIFVIGSLLYSYIKEKYLKSSGIGTDILGAFCMFLVLSVLTKIPLVGPYILLIMYILSLGIVFTLIFKRKKANN